MWKKIIKGILMENWSKKMYQEVTGSNSNGTTLKAILKANAIWEQIKKGI